MPETRVAWTPGAEPCLLRTVVDDLGGRSHLDTCQLTGQTDAAVTFTTRPTRRDQAKFLRSAAAGPPADCSQARAGIVTAERSAENP